MMITSVPLARYDRQQAVTIRRSPHGDNGEDVYGKVRIRVTTKANNDSVVHSFDTSRSSTVEEKKFVLDLPHSVTTVSATLLSTLCAFLPHGDAPPLRVCNASKLRASVRDIMGTLNAVRYSTVTGMELETN